MPIVFIDKLRWKKLSMLVSEESISKKRSVSENEIINEIIDIKFSFIYKKIKIIHKPGQRGDWDDYWLALFDGQVADGASEQLARQNLLNKLKALN